MGRRRRMGDYNCPISIAATCSLLLLLAVGSSRANNAEWRRMFPSSPYVGHETWHPVPPLQHPASPSATSKSNRVSFAAEDRAVPPPWLLPVQQQKQQKQQVNIGAFPEAQLQVRSFFDDDSFEAQFNSQPWLDPQQLPVPLTAEAAAVLPPLTATKQLGKARLEQQQVPRTWPQERVIKEKKKAVQQQQPTASSQPLAQVDFDAIAPAPSSMASLADAADSYTYDPYRVQSRSESRLSSVIKNSNNKPTAAPTLNHDSSEYDDYGDLDAAVFPSKRTSAEQPAKGRPLLIKNKSQKIGTSSERGTTSLTSSTFLSQYEPSVTSQLEAGTEADGADYYDVPFSSNNQRHSSESAEFERVQSYDVDNPNTAALRSHSPLSNSRRQQQPSQQKQRDDFQKRDHGFGTPFDERQRPPSDSFGWPQQQHPYRPLTDEVDVDFRPRDERPTFQSTSSRPSSAVHEGQHQPTRKQQQQQQQSGRDRPHTETPNFDDEFRPIFSSESHHRQQQQQPATSSEWPSRSTGSNTDRPTRIQPVRHQSSAEDFHPQRPGNGQPKRNNKPRPIHYPEEEQQRDLPLHPDFRPIQNNQQQHQSSEFDLSHDSGFQQHNNEDPQLNQRPPQNAGRRPQPQNNDDFRQHQPADQQTQTSFETPIDNEQQQQQPEHGGVEDHRPQAPGRRPPFRQQPPFNSGDQSSNNNDNNNPGPVDEGEFNFNNGPPPPRPFNGHPPGPRRPPPHRPPQNSVVTQGLNSLRNLAGSLGLQSLAGNQQQRRPQRPPNGQFRPESRRPGGPGRRPPIELSVDIGRLDKTAELEELALLGLADVQFDGDEGEEEVMDASIHIKSSSETLAGRSSSNFVKQQAIQEPVEHRVILSQDEEVIDPQDYDVYPLQHLVTSTTAAPYLEPLPTVADVVVTTSTTTTTTTTSAPIEKVSTLFPPFSKRVRPQLPTPAETQKPNKESTAGQLRITSYKQRLEAMKERAKQREQQLQPNNKEATEVDQPAASIADHSDQQLLGAVSTLSSTTISATSTTTRRPSTTRAKVPPRMPVRKPVTVSSSTTTTEKTPKFESNDDNSSKRRFKQKSSFARSQTPLDEEGEAPVAAHLSDGKDTQEEEETVAINNKNNRNTFAKIPTSPFDLRRAQLQKEAASEEAAAAVKPTASDVIVSSKKPAAKRRPNQSRTTAQPAYSSDDHASNLPAPVQSTASPQQATHDEEAEEPRIELIGIGISNDDDHLQDSTAFKDESHHDVIDQQQDDQFNTHKQPSAVTDESDNEEGSESHHRLADEEHKVEPAQEPSYLDSLLGRTRHHFSTMSTDDPILPIEELLNIRVRDNGKGMKRK